MRAPITGIRKPHRMSKRKGATRKRAGKSATSTEPRWTRTDELLFRVSALCASMPAVGANPKEAAKVKAYRAASVYEMCRYAFETVQRPHDEDRWKRHGDAMKVQRGTDRVAYTDTEARLAIARVRHMTSPRKPLTQKAELAAAKRRPRFDRLLKRLQRIDPRLEKITVADIEAAFAAPRRGPNAILARLNVVARGEPPEKDRVDKEAHRLRHSK